MHTALPCNRLDKQIASQTTSCQRGAALDGCRRLEAIVRGALCVGRGKLDQVDEANIAGAQLLEPPEL